MVADTDILPGIGKSDHSVIICKLTCSPHSTMGQERYNYRKADFDRLIVHLGQVDWNTTLEGVSVDETWRRIKAHIIEAVEKCVPKTKSKGKRKPWMDEGTLNKVSLKYSLYRKWLRSREEVDHTHFKRASNRLRKATRLSKRKLERKVADDSKSNPKAFWAYVNSKTKTRSGVPDLTRPDGSTASTDLDKAEELNHFFHSVFTLEGDGPLPPPPDYGVSETLDGITFTKDDVEKMLLAVNPDKAPGPDGLSPAVLKKASTALSYPLSVLFNRSMNESRLPADWKQALVTPIFKKGSKAMPGNYRPVSLTCIVCKIMEKLIRDKLVQHLSKSELISHDQHGFVKGRSCTTQLLEVLDVWTKVLDEGGRIDVIYMDFQKAFDTVPHRRLIHKVKAHGIGGHLLGWLKDFLADREQRVVVNGTRSSIAKVTSGVPQGSVLGPVLFLLFINDLPTGISNFIKMFADDTKLYSGLRTADDDSLQKDLEVLQDWSSKWLMRFHPEKCKVMKLGCQ